MTAPQNHQILVTSSTESDHEYDSSSEYASLSNENENTSSNKTKSSCQFFFSSLEGDLPWPVASFPLQNIKNKNRVISSIVWQVCKAIGGLNFDNGKKIEVLSGVSDGSDTCLF